MKIKINQYTFISALFSVITYTIFLFFTLSFRENFIFYMGIIFSLSIFFFFLFLFQPLERRIYFKIPTIYPKIALCFTTALSIISVLFIPPYEGIALNWMKIPLMNWVRYISALMLTSFLPGYFLLKIIDWYDSIRGIVKIVLSYLLSLFITFICGLFILKLGYSITSIGTPVLVRIIIILLVFQLITRFKRVKTQIYNINWFKIGFFICILCMIMIGSFTIMMRTLPIKRGDMERHHGIALQYLTHLPVYNGRLVGYEGLPVFHIYLAFLINLSGIPSILSVQGLYILSFMPVLAFYSGIQIWFREDKDNKIILTTLLLSMLLGFGGLYALYLKINNFGYSLITLLSEVTLKTYDIYMRVLYLPDIVAPIWNIGLPVLFTLIYIMKKDMNKISKTLFVSSLITLGYLGHAAEAIFFIIILFFYTLFFRQENEPKLGFQVTLGMTLVAMLSIISSSDVIYTTTFTTSFIIAFLTYVLEFKKTNIFKNFFKELKNEHFNSFNKLWKISRWIILYLYLFLLVIWQSILNNFNLWDWGGYSFTPFFTLPVRLGPVGLLAVITIFVYLPKLIKKHNLLFFLFLMPLGFLLEQISSYNPSLLNYPSYRYATLIFIGACVIASYGINKSLNIINKKRDIGLNKRTIVICISLCILLLSGFLSTTLYYINASYNSNRIISEEELNALKYIQLNTPNDASVLTFTKHSADLLRKFAGLNAVQNGQRWSEQLLVTSNPYLMTYILSNSNVKFIYVSQEDFQTIHPNNILTSLINYFPKVIENDVVTIYGPISLNPTSSKNDLMVAHVSSSLKNSEDYSNEWYANLTESGVPHRTYGNIQEHEWKSSEGILSGSATSNQTGNVWTSYAVNIHLNTSIYPCLSARYRVENNFTWFTIQLWNASNNIILYIGHLTERELATRNFMLPKDQIISRIELIVETTKEAQINTTAVAEIDYIKFTKPVYEWSDDTFTQGWSYYAKYGQIANWTATSDGDILKISVVSNQTDNTWISYSYPLNLLSNNSLLKFRYRVDNDDTWFTIRLIDERNQVVFYKGHITDREFTTKTYRLPNEKLTRLDIIIETRTDSPLASSAIAYLDQISITSSPFSEFSVIPALFISNLETDYSLLYLDEYMIDALPYNLQKYRYLLLDADPIQSIETILDWVSKGNTLIVINSNGYGSIANLLGEQKLDNEITKENFRLGKIIYLDLSKMDSSSKILQPTFIKEFRKQADIDKYPIYSILPLPVYNSNFNDIVVRGDLILNSDSTILKGLLTLENLLGSDKNEFNELRISGENIISITGINLNISPLESYLQIKSQTQINKGEIILTPETTLIAVNENGVTSKFKFEETTIVRFKADVLSIDSQMPTIGISGSVLFDSLDVHSKIYVPLAGIVQEKVKIEGTIIFSTRYISNPIIMFSNFDADGRITKISATIPNRNIPWMEAFLSPYNFILVFSLIFGMIWDAKRREREF